MGIIVAKFKRKKTTYDVLEKLENEIQAIEQFGRNTEQTQKKLVGRFIFVSVIVYFVLALIFYFYFFSAKLSDRLIYMIPLILLPFLKLKKNQKKLISLKEQKKKLLDDVMDKETYKVAKSILEKFAPEQVKKSDYSVALASAGTPSSTPANQSIQPGLRYRFGTSQMTPLNTRPQRIFRGPTPSMTSQQAQRPNPLPLALPRSILPKERSVLDKMVDYLVGDGPSNRYALICKTCSGHNGMALKEEFDYLSFRCCYCSTLNPARKQRPSAPTLELTESFLANNKSNNASDDNDDDINDDNGSGSGSESPPLITELSDDEQNANTLKTSTDNLSEPMEIDASNKETIVNTNDKEEDEEKVEQEEEKEEEIKSEA